MQAAAFLTNCTWKELFDLQIFCLVFKLKPQEFNMKVAMTSAPRFKPVTQNGGTAKSRELFPGKTSNKNTYLEPDCLLALFLELLVENKAEKSTVVDKSDANFARNRPL